MVAIGVVVVVLMCVQIWILVNCWRVLRAIAENTAILRIHAANTLGALTAHSDRSYAMQSSTEAKLQGLRFPL